MIRHPRRPRCSLARVAALALLAACGTFTVVAAAASSGGIAAAQQKLRAALEGGRFEEAGQAADSLVRLRGSDLARRASLRDSLGTRFFQAGTPEAWVVAERMFRAGLKDRERVLGPEHIGVARSLFTLATLLDYQGRWAEALPLAERGLAIRGRALDDRHPEYAAGLRKVGLLHFQLGDYAAAGAPLERSVEIYSSLGPEHRSSLADGLNSLGELARVQDRFGDAEARFRRGLDAAQALAADHPLRIALTNNLAGLYKDLGRYDDAIPLLERGLALTEGTAESDPGTFAVAQLNLAEVYRLQGRTLEASPYYTHALEGARRALGPDHPDLVTFLNQAAVSAQELGDFARAETLYTQTREITEKLLGPAHPLLAQNQHDLAGLYLASGRREEAERTYRRALAIREQGFGPSHPEVALTLVDLARALDPRAPDASAPLLARAIAILDSTRTYPEARLDAYALRAAWHARRGRRAHAIADMTVAIAAVDTLRSRRGGGDATRAGFVARRLVLFDRLLDWQLAQGQVERALETHERARARVLLDQISASGVDLRAGLSPGVLAPLEAAERAAESRLASAQQRLQAVGFEPSLLPRRRLELVAALSASRDSAAFDLERARDRIVDASPLWRSLLSADGRIPPASELERDLVAPDAVMLVYHVGAEASHVFTVPHSGAVQSRALVVDRAAALVLGVTPGPLTAARLERIITGARSPAWPDSAIGIDELLSGRKEAGYVVLSSRDARGVEALESRLHALWRVLVPGALWPRVRAARTAIVVPDGALHLLPFEALVVEPRARTPRARFWLDDGPALGYGASCTSLWSLARRAVVDSARAPDGAQVLSVTDVAFASGAAPGARRPAYHGHWPPLPHTARETETIRGAFAPAPVAVIRGAAAREPAVRDAVPGRRYLHLATHGFVSESSSHLLAGLVLASPADSIPRADDDGLLQIYEIYRLPLACQLAVLSACETQRGPRVAGEGAFALSRAFLAAGARRVVASLWTVRDETTAVLVGSLFRDIAEAERRGIVPAVAIALRDAKRRVREDPNAADPFYWAPFILSGP